jgi:hypothetical protein
VVAALADDGDAEQDNAHLMRLAGRFARRIRAWAAAHNVPVMRLSRVSWDLRWRSPA